MLGEIDHFDWVDPFSSVSSSVKNHLSTAFADDHRVQWSTLKRCSVLDDIDDIAVFRCKISLPLLVSVKSVIGIVVEVGVGSVLSVRRSSLIDKSLNIIDHDVELDSSSAKGVGSSREVFSRDKDVHDIALDVSVLPDVKITAHGLDELELGFIFDSDSENY